MNAPTERTGPPRPPGDTARTAVPRPTSWRGALPAGRWWKALLLVAGLLLGVQAVSTHALRERVDAPERVERFERRGFQVDTRKGLTVARKEGEATVRRDVGAPLDRDRALRAVGLPAGAALLAFLLIQLGGWLAAGRPRQVRWDGALIALWLLPTGLGVILLTRLAPDIAATPSRFPEALDWPARQSLAAAAAGLALPLVAGLAALAERWDWGQDWLGRPLAPRLPVLRRYDALLLLACALFGVTGLLGARTFGATLAVGIGGAAVQIVEVARVLLVVHAAYALADHERRFGPGDVALHPGLRDPRVLRGALAAVLAGGTALVGTHDLGVTALAAGVPLLSTVAATGSLGLLGASAGLGVLGTVAVLLLHRPAYVYLRVAALLDPFGRSETLTGVRWALAEGGLLGTGLGSGRPWAIPNVDSDFILAAVGEELGFVGVALVLLSTGALVHRGLLVAVREEEPLRKHLAAGASLAIAAQAIVIAAGTLGLMPATGVPLPLLSRGGASLVVVSVFVGLIAQVSYHPPDDQRPIQPYPGWWTVLVRLRAAGVLALGGLGACLAVAALWTLGGAGDRDRPFVDADKVTLTRELVDGGVFTLRGGRIVTDGDRLAAVALRPELRRRVSVGRQRVDGRPLSALLPALAVGESGLTVDASRFSIRNPRRRGTWAFDIVDRKDRTLAHTRKGTRRHPHAAATFPVVGHSGGGTASYLEADVPLALDLLLRRESALHPDRVMARLVSLLDGHLGARRPEAPYTARATIDLDVQRNAMDALGSKRGVAVAMSMQDGAILAMAATPSLDADALLRAGTLDDAFRDPDLRPRAHRALKERYPPGSVFKLLTAAAAVDAGLTLDAADTTCDGYDEDLRVGDAGSARERGHGTLTPITALGKSCNLWFGRSGVRLGPALPRMGRKLGLDRTLSLVPWVPEAELSMGPSHLLTCRSTSAGGLASGCRGADGADGLAPVGDRWLARNPGLVARGAFGQSVVEVTPMAMLMLTAAVAGQGERPLPRLLERIDGRCGKESCPLALATPHAERVLAPATADAVRAGMIEAYQRGTASRAALPLRLGLSKGRYTLERAPQVPVPVAAKTGTAEVDGGAEHAWFVAFAPAEAPRVVVVALVEHGGAGAAAAGPVAMRLLRDALNAL